jgi:hypothetical protein
MDQLNPSTPPASSLSEHHAHASATAVAHDSGWIQGFHRWARGDEQGTTTPITPHLPLQAPLLKRMEHRQLNQSGICHSPLSDSITSQQPWLWT